VKRLAALGACLWLLAAPAVAVAACPQTSVADIEDEVMCPVCGTPLALATGAPQADAERAFILDLVEDCRTKPEILDALVAEYGPGVLALPPATGFDVAAYAVPIVAVLMATGLVIVLVIRWRRSQGEPLDEAPPNAGSDDADRLLAEERASEEDEQRLDADLRRYDL
jgi:cytochrome c-type biogenesis protein CcmH/NrfF